MARLCRMWNICMDWQSPLRRVPQVSLILRDLGILSLEHPFPMTLAIMTLAIMTLAIMAP